MTKRQPKTKSSGVLGEVMFVGFALLITFAGLAYYAINGLNTRCNAPDNVVSYAKVVEVQKYRYDEKELKDANDILKEYDLSNCK